MPFSCHTLRIENEFHQFKIDTKRGAGMFTKDLIDRTIKYFEKECGQSISEETAEIYLNSFADLFGSFDELLRENQELRNYESQV